jgi:hypothetical protein
MGNGFRRGKAARDDVLIPGCLYNGRFTAFVSVFTAILAGVGVIDIFPNYHLGRDNLQSPDNFLANLSHGFTALRAYQLLTLQTVFHLLGFNALGNGVQCILMLLVPLVGGYSGDIFFFLLSSREYLSFIEQ